jgi:hypothetical protein
MPQALVQSGSPPKLGASQAAQSGRDLSPRFSVGSMSHTGTTWPHRTATAVGHATAGPHISQGVSLLVAARPTADRSPLKEHNANCRSPRVCQIRMGSGTLRLMEEQSKWQLNAEVSRPSHLHARLGHVSKGCSSNAAPNHFIEGTVKGLRPSPAPHVER